MSEEFEYSKVNSENAELLKAMINGTGYTKETESRNAAILKSIINNTEYNEPPQSEIEELLLELKEKGWGGDIDLQTLNVTENGTVYAPSGVAYNKVVTNVPIPSNAYFKKSVANLPAPIASFTDGADAPLNSLTASIVPVQSGSGDPSPTNVRPISGWTEEVITRTGKNLLKTEATSKTQGGVTYTVNDDGTITVNGTATGYSSIALGTAIVKSSMGTITISGIAYASNIMWASVDVWDKDRQLVVNITGGSQNPALTFDLTPYPNACFITASVKRNSNVATSGTIKPQIELGSTATTFEPYAGTTYTIPFTDSQGQSVEVFGGSVDVVNGVLTVDRGMLTLNGSEAYYSIQSSSADDNTVLRVATGQVCKQNENQKSNYGTYNNNAWQLLASRVNTFVLGSEGNLYLQIPSSTASTVEEFKALFASNPLQVCYELTTPITIQLTPTAVKSLDGVNNVFASTGDVLEAEYLSKSLS